MKPSPFMRRSTVALLAASLCIMVTAVIAHAAHGTPTEKDLRKVCFDNLTKLNPALKLFASDHEGRFPELSPEAGCLMFANESPGMKPVFPTYVTSLSWFVCPSGAHAELAQKAETQPDVETMMDDYSYFYLGYVVTNEDDLKAFAQAYTARTAKELRFNEDLDTPKGKLYRLREDKTIYEAVPFEAKNFAEKIVRLQAIVPVRPENSYLLACKDL